jgi:hypothetical protein
MNKELAAIEDLVAEVKARYSLPDPALRAIEAALAFARKQQAIIAAPEGMTLRDYFAARCMQSLALAQFSELGESIRNAAKADGVTPHDYMASIAYAYAEAMLKARAS